MTEKSTRLSYRRVGVASIALACMLIAAVAMIIPQHGALAATQATNSAMINVNAGQSLGTMPATSKGLNSAVWDGHLLDSAAMTAVKNVGINVVRYPGGSTSDVYHWENNTGSALAANTFDAFMGAIQPIGAQPMITVNYGTGTAQEAADWVHYANKGGAGYNGVVPTYPGASRTGHTFGIKYWEVGNEVYGNGTYTAKWEADNHPLGPATYANNVVAYSQAMKAVDPSIKVGVVLTAPGNWPDGVTSATSPQPWNTTVLPLTCSSIDFVIPHWYPQNPGSESDATLLNAPNQIPSMVASLRSELTQFCGARASSIQIMVTETNSVSSNPGKQTVSLVNALYMNDNYMSWLENGVANVDWWTLHNGVVSGSNNSPSLFGNAQFGDYGVLASGGCTTAGACEPAPNTPLPAYFGLQMLTHVGAAGDTMVSSSSNQPLVAVHAVKQANGNLAVLMINKDLNNSYTVSLGINGYSASSNATIFTYGQNSTAVTSAAGSPSSITLAPYSLNTIVLQPGVAVTPPPTPRPTNTPVSSPTPVPTNTPTPASGTCKVTYTVSQWSTGFTGTLLIANTGTAPINGWKLTFTFPGSQQLVQGWSGVFSQQGNTVTVTDAGYNATIASGMTANPGFNGSWSGSNPSPTAFTLNGSACSVG